MRTIIWTSLGQFVLTKETTLPAILKKCEGKQTLKLETVTDGGDVSKTELNLNEVKIFGVYNIAKSIEEELVEMDKTSSK